MQAEVITRFIPDLITAISDCVQRVSDKCLANGLITEPTYKKVLESGGTSEDKARTLILAVKKSTETDSRCFEILLDILSQELPFGTREKLLSDLREKLSEKANKCREVVPATTELAHIPTEEFPKESALQHSTLLGRFEDATRQHERACAEKKQLQEKLKKKTEKCEKLKRDLESIRSQNETTINIESKITACMSQIESLKEQIRQLEKKIEEQAMQVKRGQNTINTKIKKLFVEVVQQCHQEISKNKEEHSQALRETEASTLKKAEEDMRVRDREHQLAVQEKELRITQLKLAAKQRDSAGHEVIPKDILKPEYLDNLYWSTTGDNLSSVGVHWRDIGSQLGFSAEEMDTIHLENSYTDRKHCLHKLLYQWLEWYPGDGRGSTSFPTYSRIQKVLVDIGLGNVARDFMTYEDIKKPPLDEHDIQFY